MKKRILCIFLAFAMVTSAVACGKGKETGNGESGGALSEGGKYEPAITLTSVRENTNSAVQDYKEGESVENNVWTELMEEKYGIKIKYDWLAANGSDYNTKVNLMLADQKIPDFLQIKTQATLGDMVDADLLQPLDEVWEKYASDLTKKTIAEAGDAVMKACTIDGKLMAIPWTSAPKESTSLLYIRQDWLDNLGLKAPKTMQDVLDIAVAFATQDPDKDGKNDTYALNMYKAITGNLLSLFYANDFYNGNWYIDDNGVLTNGLTEDGYKKTLQLLADWIAKGYIHPEWFTFTQANANEQIINGEVGLFFGGYGAGISPLAQQHTKEPDSDWLVMPCPDWEGDYVKQFCSLGINGYWVVSKECEHPEAVVLMMNEFVERFYYSTDMEEYYKYINSEEGVHVWQNSLVRTYRGLKNAEVAKHMEMYYAGEMKMEELTAEERATVAQIDAYKAGDETMWQWNKVFGMNGGAAQTRKIVDADAYVNVITYGTATMTEVTNATIMNDFANEWRIGLLTGEKSFDDWDKYVKNYKSLGYETIRQEIIEKYDLDAK